MKRILLTGTALAGGMLFASVAQAQITVSLGGYTEFFGAYYDDDVPGRTSREFQLETEIVVRADGKADNGLLYGTKIELQNSTGGGGATGVGVDEASVYVGGTWGRIELGDFDGAADTLAIYAPVVGIEQIDGDAYDFLAVEQGGFSYGSQPIGSMVQAPDAGDSTKIMYLTPRFAGIQAGISYATQDGSEAQDVVGFKTAGGYKDFWEAGVNYTGEFSGFSVAASVTGSTATGQDLGFVGGPTLEDFWAWQAGAQVGYGGFKVGGGYIDAGDYNAISGVPGSSGDSSVWHVGVSYTAGPVAVGLSYADAEGFKSGPSFDETTFAPSVGTYATSYKTYGGGVAYTIAPGFVVQADVMYVDEDLRNVDLTTGAAATTSNEGYVAVLSTRLDF